MREAEENYVPCKPPVEKGREKGKIKKNGIQSTAKRDKHIRAAAFKIHTELTQLSIMDPKIACLIPYLAGKQYRD